MAGEILRLDIAQIKDLLTADKIRVVAPPIAPEVRPTIPSIDIQRQEQQKWLDLLGTRVDIKPLPAHITPEVQRKLEGMGLKIVYIPQLNLDPTSLKNKEVSAYLNDLAGRYPKWKPYEFLSNLEKTDHTVVRNLNKWYWERVKKDTVGFPVLYGQYMAVEMMPKPKLGDKYQKSDLTGAMGLNDRFDVSWNNATQGIITMKSFITSKAGLDRAPVIIRMLTALEWNLLANREGWGKTNTYEWVNDEYRGSGDSGRLMVGYSDLGGAAYALWGPPDRSRGYVGFRVAVVLGAG